MSRNPPVSEEPLSQSAGPLSPRHATARIVAGTVVRPPILNSGAGASNEFDDIFEAEPPPTARVVGPRAGPASSRPTTAPTRSSARLAAPPVPTSPPAGSPSRSGKIVNLPPIGAPISAVPPPPAATPSGSDSRGREVVRAESPNRELNLDLSPLSHPKSPRVVPPLTQLLETARTGSPQPAPTAPSNLPAPSAAFTYPDDEFDFLPSELPVQPAIPPAPIATTPTPSAPPALVSKTPTSRMEPAAMVTLKSSSTVPHQAPAVVTPTSRSATAATPPPTSRLPVRSNIPTPRTSGPEPTAPPIVATPRYSKMATAPPMGAPYPSRIPVVGGIPYQEMTFDARPETYATQNRAESPTRQKTLDAPLPPSPISSFREPLSYGQRARSGEPTSFVPQELPAVPKSPPIPKPVSSSPPPVTISRHETPLEPGVSRYASRFPNTRKSSPERTSGRRSETTTRSRARLSPKGSPRVRLSPERSPRVRLSPERSPRRVRVSEDSEEYVPRRTREPDPLRSRFSPERAPQDRLSPKRREAIPPDPAPRQEPPAEKEKEATEIKYDDVRRHLNGHIYVPEGHVLIDTEYGSYIVPKYNDMSVEEQQRHRATFELRFQILNETWNKHQIHFDMPKAEETVTNIHVRYKQSVKYLMIRSGVTLWKYILCGFWMTFELIACKIGLKASGFYESQLQLYEIYHSQLIEMGEMTGFGEGWPAWIKILVISLVNGAIFILMNTFFNGSGGAGTPFMRIFSSFILGTNPTISTDNEHGIPTPTDANPLGNLAGMFGGGGGGAAGGGGGGGIDLGSIMSGLFSGFTNRMQNGGGGGNAPPAAAPPTRPPGRSPTSSGGPPPRRPRRGPTHDQ